MRQRTYIAVDLKSFYASVECMERGLNPLTTNLVVADASRTEKTICLAVSPSLKAYGISGRARLFEVVQRVGEINAKRRDLAPEHALSGSSADDLKVRSDPSLALDFLAATPRMAYYMDYSTRVYQVYLKYFSPEDIVVYSIDEVFIDATPYLSTYRLTGRELAARVIRDVLRTTGITATAGIGTNLYLCKIAMDVVAKHVPADQDGVRIAELDETSYRRILWSHRPLTDFWRVGRATAKKLEAHGMLTMGDVARCSVSNEELLYRLFGVNAELLIDHAWGWEPCEIRHIKAYRPENSSFSSGQVLMEPYTADRARVVVHEMADAVALELVSKGMVTDQMVLTIGYDRKSLELPGVDYSGEVTADYYGRKVPKHAHGTANLGKQTSSGKTITAAVLNLYDRIVDPSLLIRRITIDTNHVMAEEDLEQLEFEQMDLFGDSDRAARDRAAEEKERRMQEAMLKIKQKYGKNAIVKGISYEDGATGRERNAQIGGHKA